MQEKSLTSQRLVYDAIHNGRSWLSNFQITPVLRRSSLLSYQSYKLELEKNAELKVNNSTDLKHKIKREPDSEKTKDGYRSNYQST